MSATQEKTDDTRAVKAILTETKAAGKDRMGGKTPKLFLEVLDIIIKWCEDGDLKALRASLANTVAFNSKPWASSILTGDQRVEMLSVRRSCILPEVAGLALEALDSLDTAASLINPRTGNADIVSGMESVGEGMTSLLAISDCYLCD